MDRDFELKKDERETLGTVSDYRRFCELIFALKDPFNVQCEISNIYFGNKPSISSVNKVALLTRTIYDSKEVTALNILDDEGNKYDILDIAKNINPERVGGIGCISELNSEQREKIIEECWLKDSRSRAENLANQLGGVYLPLNNFDFNSGMHSAIFFLDKEDERPKINVFRGIRELSEKNLNQQVCGMLRANHDRMADVINDPELVNRVSDLAIEPNENNLNKVIDRYQELGLLDHKSTAEMVLDSVKRKMKHEDIDFDEAMQDVHLELYSGVIGGSPYLATTTHMENTINFTGNEGAIIVIRPRENEIKNPKSKSEKEVYIKVGVKKSDIVALIPINKVKKEITLSNIDEIKKHNIKVREVFSKVEEEILQCLDIFYND